MKKFRDYMYIDKERVNSYLNQINEYKKDIKSESYKKTSAVDGEANMMIAKTSASINEEKTINYNYNEDQIEKLIEWSLDKKNAINYTSGKLDNNDKDKLIIVTGNIFIPEVSQNLEMINTFNSMKEILSYANFSNEDIEKLSLIKGSNNIPIILENEGDYLFCTKIQKDNMTNSSEQISDYEDEITILGKIDKIYNTNEKVEIFNLARDYFKINRTMLRSMNQDSLETMIVKENGPLIKITPIIIYK